MKVYVSHSPASPSWHIHLLDVAEYEPWLHSQPERVKNWLKAQQFSAKNGKFALLPPQEGKQEKSGTDVVAVAAKPWNLWTIAHLPAQLPAGEYALQAKGADVAELALGWQLATYQFTRFKPSAETAFPSLIVGKEVNLAATLHMAEAIFMGRELINRPANDLTPYALAEAVAELAKKHGATYREVKGDALEKGYPLIHAVGRASVNPPALSELVWGEEKHPKVTLVGKGICFDSGGLDIKPSSGMLLMKKDMGGAAAVLALAHAVMSARLPVRLRVLVAAAENSVSGNAFRPKDIITSRKGLTVEIGNTDAEGRLVLCDALADADGEAPDLLVDFATLTGAARVALGTDVPALFTDDEELAATLTRFGKKQADPLWQLPLVEEYRDMLQSPVADICNAPESGFGGAITAALYLKTFVEKAKTWAHIDLMAWNVKARPGRPAGGEVMGVRTLFAYLQERCAKGW